MAWSPDGRRIAASGGNYNTLNVWDAEKGQKLLSLKGHTGAVYSVAWSPDGNRVVSACADKTLRIWDIE